MKSLSHGIPRVKGGQGRPPRELERSAHIVAIGLVGSALVLISALVWWLFA